MRVLLTAAPSTGHIVPLLGIGTALRDIGHHVRLATHRSAHNLATRCRIECFDVGMSEEQMATERPLRWPETQHQPVSQWAVRMFTEILAPSALEGLRDVVQDWRPDLVIHEEGEYAGPVAAASHGIPWVTHGWGSPLRSTAELASLEADAASLWRSTEIDMPAAAGLYRHGLLNPCPPSLQSQAPGAATVWPIQPMPFQTGLNEATSPPLPSGDRGLAYIGFGTVARNANAADALTAAIEAVVYHDLDAVVTTGNDALAHQLEAAHPGRVKARRFVSLPDLLPRCRLVICHGGAGTVLAALRAGVPLVLLPGGTPSQLRMTDSCDTAGLARVTTLADATQAVASLLSDTSLAYRTNDIAREIDQMPHPTKLVSVLEDHATAT